MNLASIMCNPCKQWPIKRIKHGLSSGYHRIEKKKTHQDNYCNQSTSSSPTPTATPSVSVCTSPSYINLTMPDDCCESPKRHCNSAVAHPVANQRVKLFFFFLSFCLYPRSRGKTVCTSSVVWLIPDKLCSLQLQGCVVRKREGFSVEEESSNADYFLFAESMCFGLDTTESSVMALRCQLNSSSKWMFTLRMGCCLSSTF